MKTTVIRSAFALLAMAGIALASCTSDKNYYDAEKAIEIKKAEYAQNFTNYFGQPAESHNWGFDSIPSADPAPATRAAQPDQNWWNTNIANIPAQITEEETQAVYAAFRNYSGQGSVTLSCTDFFVQQVGNRRANMDQLKINGQDVNNFNGNSGEKMLMLDTPIDGFTYRNSLDGKVHDEYLAIEVPGYGCYVGFDFCATGQNPNQQVVADGVYDDWIVKVIPAEYKYQKRVMCEDLGLTDDFDFNDVVFDVYINYNEWWHGSDMGVIKILAAGGTLPISVAGHDVHEALGIGAKEMRGIGEVEPVIIKFTPTSNNPIDIPIVVTTEALQYSLDAPMGGAPFKICVPTSVAPSGERTRIDATYPKFSEWVADPTKPFWE